MKTPPRSRTSPSRARTLALRLVPALALVILGPGCVGYNQTLFYTKSNVGLDFDAKPPTTEISVSRKEGVIAPSFEGGQTPPVMASFQPHGGNGNTFESFFFGVDQTFAGGDAAIAMAELYDSPLAGSTAKDAYDSAITVADPTAPFDWQKIPAGSTARPFVFATDTLWGVKVGWTGQVPDSVKAGFNREEIAWAPISRECADDACKPAEEGRACVSTNCIPGRVKLRGPSFLASIDHNVEIKGGAAKAGSIQYFATGRAATLLARQPAVRKAMLTRMDPDSAFDVRSPVLGEALVLVSNVLDRRAGTLKEPDAIRHQTALDALTGITVPAVAGMNYRFSPTAGSITEAPARIPPSAQNLAGLIGYNSFLVENADHPEAAIQAALGGATLTFQTRDGATLTDVSAVYERLRVARAKTSEEIFRFRRQLAENQAVLDAYHFALDSIQNR